MFFKLLLLASIQIGPFFQEKPDYLAVRPLVACEKEDVDVLWPLFTAHRDWWRALFILHYQSSIDGDWQFEAMPLWFNGHDSKEGAYWGLFPLFGYHPHFALVYDWKFALWPLWMQYRMPRPSKGEWFETTAILFPFVHWRSDGSYGVWPIVGLGRQRESDHRYFLWPIFTWANYRADRDTAGAGNSWMFWPLCASVDRERESAFMVLPPFFSHSSTPSGWRGRYPWPLIEIERRDNRDRTSVFPLYERIAWKGYAEGSEQASVTRFLWKLVELYDDETRVFPFWVSRKDGGFFRFWPFYESEKVSDDVTAGRTLALFPIRWSAAVERNWSKFWTFYEYRENPVYTEHSLFWNIISWRTLND